MSYRLSNSRAAWHDDTANDPWEQFLVQAQEYEHAPPRDNGPDIKDVWQLATIEADGHVDKTREILLDEIPRGIIGNKAEAALADMRACLREAIRRRILAERWLRHLHGKDMLEDGSCVAGKG